MSYKKIFFFVLINLSYGFSQSGSSSPYSSAGLGDINFRGTQVTRFLGGLDVFTDSIHANLNNPGSYGDLKVTTYSLGIHSKTNSLSDNDNKKIKHIAALDYLAVGIPAGKFGFGFGLIPYSSVGYKVQSTSEESGLNITNRHEGSGGINQTFLSFGFPFLKYFTTGITMNYGFGNLFYNTSQYKENINLATFINNSSSISGFSYQVSLNVKIPIKEKYLFRIMYSIQPEANLNSRNERIIYTQNINGTAISDFESVDLGLTGLRETDLLFPKTEKIGIGLGKNKKWFIGIQKNSINSSIFKNDFIEKENITYNKGSQFSLGGFYIPNYSSMSSYWKRVVYRLGFRSENTGLVFNSIPIKETSFAIGIGVPMNGLSNANIGIEFGERGDKKQGLIKENFISFRVGFSLNDRWFVKRKYN